MLIDETVQIGEAVRVFTDETGRPAGFTWRNQNYLVSEDPIRWFSRRNWWLDAKSVQRGVGANVLEIEMWRLVASALSQVESGLSAISEARAGAADELSTKQAAWAKFELAHHQDASDNWRLLRTLD
jgi:hypothetical protein